MGFFPDEALQHLRRTGTEGNSFESILAQFPVSLKKALYAAAAKNGAIGARRWSGQNGKPGCALNEAGQTQGASITSTGDAARVFGVSRHLVQRFIERWDGLKMAEVNRPSFLMRMLDAVSITARPEDISTESGEVLIFDELIHVGTATQFKEQLEQVDTLADLGFTDEEIDAVGHLSRELELV